MEKRSAGILLYRIRDEIFEVFLVHPGGPYWSKKDEGVWSIPKGEFNDSENALDAAKREFKEETGKDVSGDFIALSPVKLKSGKIVHAWGLEGDIDPSLIICNAIAIEWPPKSGIKREFPEVDRGEWFNHEIAKKKINPAQFSFIEELVTKLRIGF